MKIIAGSGRGRRLRTPRGSRTRPTGGRVRQTLFDILAPRLADSAWLDLFAGGGGVGIEALSRGARRAVFVELSAPALAALRENLRALGAGPDRVAIRSGEWRPALRALERAGERFDVTYVDPPYASGLYEPVLEALSGSGLLAPGGLVVAEHFKKTALPDRIGTLARGRLVRVGEHHLSFYARTGGEG